MKTVSVLMSTYNGERFLRTQIESVLAQEGVLINLLVRDDGSSDKTTTILEEYAKKGMLSWYRGNNVRPAQSFYDLIFSTAIADYYALCDQDDFWLPGKLNRAVEKMSTLDSQKPQLYYSATTLVDEKLGLLKENAKPFSPIVFSESIISSGATGCTMCFNNKMMDLLRLHRPVVGIMHDAWIHKLCLAVGGDVFFDEKSFILYRQHGNNVVGATSSLAKRWRRRWNGLKKMSRIRSTTIVELYDNYAFCMPDNNQKIASYVVGYNKSFILRILLALNFKIRFPQKLIDMYYRLAVVLGIF